MNVCVLMNPSNDECAAEILEVIPLVMRSIRTEMRRHRTPDLSVPQFRTLAFLRKNRGTSLSGVAEHIGITLPSASKIIDGLVLRKLATRCVSLSDRRHVALALTPLGSARLRAMRKRAKSSLTRMLQPLSAEDLVQIVSSMRRLRPVFALRTPDRAIPHRNTP